MKNKRIRIVLVGGGHTHALVLQALRRRAEPQADVTLIATELLAPYSGMLPGFVAGHYSAHDLHIDLPRLCEAAGARAIHGRAIGIDRAARRVILEGGDAAPYDILSINVGITPALADIDGAAEQAIAVKPVSTFAARWQALERRILEDGGARRIAVVGGGAAGVELALAAVYRFRSGALGDGAEIEVTLVTGGGVLESFPSAAAAYARAALAREGVTLIEGRKAAAIGRAHITFEDGGNARADAALLATQATAPEWFRQTDLPLTNDGYIAVRDTLQVLDDDRVFAVGDCATAVDHPRPKAGVFAVRQAPPLIENLRRAVDDEAARSFIPQEHYLALISLGRRRAIACRGSLCAEGAWVWRWKDWIDRRFMRQFETQRSDSG